MTVCLKRSLKNEKHIGHWVILIFYFNCICSQGIKIPWLQKLTFFSIIINLAVLSGLRLEAMTSYTVHFTWKTQWPIRKVNLFGHSVYLCAKYNVEILHILCERYVILREKKERKIPLLTKCSIVLSKNLPKFCSLFMFLLSPSGMEK